MFFFEELASSLLCAGIKCVRGQCMGTETHQQGVNGEKALLSPSCANNCFSNTDLVYYRLQIHDRIDEM